MSTFSELLSMYFIILIFFLYGLLFFPPPNLTKISPLFVPITVGSEKLITRMEEKALSACQPGLLPLPCYFLIACGLSMELVFSLAIHQWDSQRHGQRRAVLLALPAQGASTAGFHSWWAAPEEEELSSSPFLQHSWLCPLLFLRQTHWLPRHNLWHKARQDLSPNQRPHQCVIQVSMSVCLSVLGKG